MLGATVAIGVVAGPASANAGTVSLANGVFKFKAGSGETNDVTLTGHNGSIEVVDTGASLTATGACAGGGSPGTPATCTHASGGIHVVLQLGDRGDTAELVDTATPSVRIAGIFRGGSGNDRLIGASRRDYFVAGDGNDHVEGGDGDDYYRTPGRDGKDEFEGGGGSDLTSYFAARTPIEVTLDGNANDGPAHERDNIDSERVSGGSKPDELTGDSAANTLIDYVNGAGVDLLRGGGDDDNLLGRDGRQRLWGGSGEDYIVGGYDRDRMLGGTGKDTINAILNDPLDPHSPEGGAGRDFIDCGAGRDTVYIDGHDRVRHCERVHRS
jgi:Ca2+-binding RTX toxin-like protein